VNTQTLDELSRFWLADGRRRLLVDARTLDSLIGELSRNFLTYVERRYGVAAGTRLWGHVSADPLAMELLAVSIGEVR